MKRQFYTNSEEIKFKTEALKEIGKSNDGWTINYVDENNQKWKLNFYETEYRRAGIQVLKETGNISVIDLITIATESQNCDDILGAAVELYFEENSNKKDFREDLSQRLNQFDLENLSEFDKERLKTIIFETSLYDATNRREIIGKKREEVENDAKYYLKNTENANRILEKIK